MVTVSSGWELRDSSASYDRVFSYIWATNFGLEEQRIVPTSES